VVFEGQGGEAAASRFSHSFCCFNVCIIETLHVDHHHHVLGHSPLQQQGPHQQSTVQDKPANKDRKKPSRKAREGNPPLHRGLGILIASFHIESIKALDSKNI
jgi:hypothetical protein